MYHEKTANILEKLASWTENTHEGRLLQNEFSTQRLEFSSVAFLCDSWAMQCRRTANLFAGKFIFWEKKTSFQINYFKFVE